MWISAGIIIRVWLGSRPDIALGRELVKLPPVVRKTSISAVNTKLQEQVPSYRAGLANMATQTTEYAARSRLVAGHIPTEAISALYKANIAVPNSVVLVSGAIAATIKCNDAKRDAGFNGVTGQRRSGTVR